MTLCACDAPAPEATASRPQPGAEPRDVFDAPAIETPADAVNSVPEWKLGAKPITTITGSETDDNYLFYNTRSALRLSDTRILVAPSGEALRFFGSDGKYLSTRGRKGAGPGEFQQIQVLALLPGDTIATYDQHRISFFDSTGTFVTSYNLATTRGGGRQSALTADGTLFSGNRMRDLGDEVGKRQERFALVAFDRTGSPKDTLGIIDGMWLMMGGGGGSSLAFTGIPRVIASGNRVFVTEGDVYEIRVFENARPLHLIRNLIPRYPVTNEDRDQIIKGTTPATSEAQAAGRRQRAKEALDQHPAIDDLLADREGNVWALHSPPARVGPAMWHIYGPDGRLRARMARPPKGTVRDIGEDYVLITHHESLVITRIEVFPLIKR